MTEASIESLTLVVDGSRVHYLKAGQGFPIVLLHGGASDCRDWVGTMTALSGSYAMYAPYLIGYGESDRKKEGYYLTELVDFVQGFVRGLGLSSYALVGHSLGGRICLDMALRCPDEVDRLVLVDTLGFGRLRRLGSFMGTAAWAVRKVLGRPQPYPSLLTREGENHSWLCLDGLSSLKVSTMVVWSRFDPYFSLAGAIRAAEEMPGVRLEVLPGYGHAPHKSRNGQFNALLLDFMGR
jgi:4,5:9,10-diseco-3-hydroxy-5,9,17-trioxoandrosta-1(10),2-diene-4-oate hydrolase